MKKFKRTNANFRKQLKKSTVGRGKQKRKMKRRRAGDVAEGVEGEAAQGGAGFDTGARHYRDTKQVKNDLKAIHGAVTSPH